ncbi:MAG: hypothetical protein ACRD0J_03740 [Acidimicrobiales bacterium]
MEPGLAVRERQERDEALLTFEERRSLAFGRATAVKLLAKPVTMLAKGRRQLSLMWADSDGSDRTYLAEWTRVLAQGAEPTAALLSSTSQRAADLRSCSPFAGVLTQPERWDIITATRETARGETRPA